MNYAEKQIEEIKSKYPQALTLLRILESIDRIRGEEWDSMSEKDLAKLKEIVKYHMSILTINY